MAFGYKLKWEKGWFDPSSKEPFTLSRSKVELFQECKRCFWLEARYGIGRPSSFPFTLNNVVDELFKKEFDIRRAKGEKHPLCEKYNVDAIPYAHEKIEEWRDALKRGIKHHHKETNIILRGGIDDIWKDNKTGELYIVDYKATAGKETVTLDEEWKNSYKRQVEVYQWLFRQNDFPISNTAYFVYANGQNDREAFDGKLEFEVTLLPYEGDDSWVEGALRAMKECLVSETAPEAGTNCEYCPYRKFAGMKLQELMRKEKASKK